MTERKRIRLAVNPVTDNYKRCPRSLARAKRPAHFPPADRALARAILRVFARPGWAGKAAITRPVITKVD